MNQTKQNNSVDILMLGHFAKDRNIVDGQVEVCSGGQFTTAASRSAEWDCASPSSRGQSWTIFTISTKLKQEGVQVHAKPAAETSVIANSYDSADMERRVLQTARFRGTVSDCRST